jgi:hypothetical protein
LKFIGILFLAFLPLISVPFLSFLSNLTTNVSFEEMVTMFTFFYTSYLLIVWTVGFAIWTDYYLDLMIITNKRIMYVDQKGLFSREMSTLRYQTIQDLTSDIVGVLRTFLNYGELYIQTAAAVGEFSIKDIANPTLVKEIISREVTRVMEERFN